MPGSRLARCVLLAFAIAVASVAAAPLVRAEPPNTHEILSERPSGFWTSNRPAVGGAYRWRLLGLGVVIAAATGYGMLRLIRRANAERAGRQPR
ncbi:MAG TPA: hypothetical protein VIX73_06920 [Kofleriaceae bacterium]